MAIKDEVKFNSGVLSEGFKNDETPLDEYNLNQLVGGILFNNDLISKNNKASFGSDSIPSDIDDNSDDVSKHSLKKKTEYLNTLIYKLEDKDVVVKQPKFEVTIKDGNNEMLKSSYEIGSKININYNISLDPGEYKYGDKTTGVTATAYRVTVKGTNKTTQSGSFSDVELTSNGIMISSTGNNYSEGKVPVSNLGNPVLEKQIKETKYNDAYINGTQSSSMVISAYRMGCFFGALTSTKTITELTSGNIRDDLQTVEKDSMNRSINKSNKAFPTSGETFSFTIPAGAKSVVIACPKGTGTSTTYGPSYVLNNTANAPMYELFGGNKIAKIININGNNNYAAEPYNVWMYTPATPYTQNTKFTVSLGSLSIS